MPAPPPGNAADSAVQRLFCTGKDVNRKTKSYKIFVLFATFFIYTMYHMSRKPFSVVKSVLNQNCTKLEEKSSVNHNESNWCDWAPFDGSDATELLGALDSCFLFAYAFAMFFSGYFAERANLRYYLSGGMLLSGISVLLFGLAYWWKIHNFYYYAAVMVFGGLVQTSGWPAVVTCVGNWFGKEKRGLIFGIWNSHTSAGNILGSLIAGAFVKHAWGYSFVIPAIIMIAAAIFVFLFLPPYPDDIGCNLPEHGEAFQGLETDIPESADEKSPMVKNSSISYSVASNAEAVGIWRALKIPGVIEFATCLLFAKAVSYTFLYWLPRYIHSTHQFDPEYSADISTIFDAGGILGGIIAGQVSDMTGCSASICIIMLLLAAPMLYLYQFFGQFTIVSKIALLFFTGSLVNGPYALITTAVSAELGTSPTLRGNSKALSTVTAIIDGTGSIGAAIGPLLAGFLVNGGWAHVFNMLIISDLIAAIFVARIAYKEVKRYLANFQARQNCSCCFKLFSCCCHRSVNAVSIVDDDIIH